MARKILKTLALATVVVAMGCNTTPVQDGAVVGGALGSALGAVIGHQSGNQGEGALIGLGLGALSGAIVGDSVEKGRVGVPPQQQSSTARPQRGHYETRIVESETGETYEERVWVPHR